MAEGTYKIRYRKGDFEIELQGDKEWVEQKFQKFIESKAVTAAAVGAKELADSLVEFLKNKGNPKKHMDRAIIFSYWLFHREGMQAYNISDVAKCYDEARITTPKNLTDIMNKLEEKGYLKPAGEKDNKKAWVITQSGEEYVDQ